MGRAVIQVESANGFFVSLPRTVPGLRARSVAEVPKFCFGYYLPMKHVCLIEHDESLNAFISAALVKAGFLVTSFRTSSDAREHIFSQPPDLAIVELFLPGVDGIETMYALRRLFPDLSVLMLVGQPHVLAFSSIARALKLGANSALQAPFSGCELVLKVNRMLEQYALVLAGALSGPIASPEPI